MTTTADPRTQTADPRRGEGRLGSVDLIGSCFCRSCGVRCLPVATSADVA